MRLSLRIFAPTLTSGLGVDPPADRHLLFDVLCQVRRVECEYESAAAHGLVEADDEALMAWCVTSSQHDSDPRCYLAVARP